MNARQYINTYYSKMTSNDIKQICHQSLSAIAFCHENNIIHRDVKLDNILLSIDEDGKVFDVKLADFGKAIRIDDVKELRGICGTVGYMAPEMMSKKQIYGKEIDCWCMGICLYGLISGTMPF